MKKKIISVIAAFACMFAFLCACGKVKAKEPAATLRDVVLWGMPGTEKVYKDIGIDSDYYKAYKTDAKIDIVMAKGEYEGGQIIASANRDVTFDASSSALMSGENTIAAENVEIFAQKYVSVATNHDQNSKLPTAKYPDALVPMANLKAVGENIVKQGENQGLYVRVKTAVDQAAGVYTGNITFSVGAESTQIPVKVQVADVAVSETVHNKSVFANAWYFFEGELDTTQEMLDKYNEALLDYRLGMGTILTYGRHHNEDLSTQEKIDAWVEKAYGYMQDPACSTILLPYREDEDQMKEILNSIADYSIEKKYDMFDKLVVYPAGLIDEPRGNGTMEKATKICRSFESVKNTFVATDLAAKTLPSEIAGIGDSIRKIPMIVTEYYDETLADAGATFCPTYQHYETEEQRAEYAGNSERWWYGCITPRAPYPTYHIDDTWLSARLVGWMQAQYGVAGNLYWATDAYAQYSQNGYQSLEEYYEGSAVRYPDVNGDGYLFYPGKKYGVEGPLGSMRLEAIRDGYEEYEILYAIKQRYIEADKNLSGYELNFEKFVGSLTESMYTGTTVAVTTDEFNTAKLSLFESSILNEKTGFSVIEYADDGYGVKTYSFAVDSDWTVKTGDSVKTPVATQGDMSVYTFSCALTEDKNELRLSFENGGATVQYVLDLGGKAQVKQATAFTENDFAAKSVEPSLTETANGWQIALPEITDEETAEQSFALVGNCVAGIDAHTRKVVLHVIYAGNDGAALTVNGKFAGSRVASKLASCVLQQGVNEIAIDLSVKDMQTLGAVEQLVLGFYRVENAASIPAHTITLKDMVYYAA